MITPIRLNIGSGQRPFGVPWINVDTQAKWSPDVVMDGISCLYGCPPNSVDMICLHHVLEHYGCGEARTLLRVAYGALQPRGSLLVFVPDIPALCGMFQQGLLSDQVFLTNLYGAYMGDEADRHKWGFTYTSLLLTLREAGFRTSNIHAFDWRDIQGANIAKDHWILGMEAYK